MGIMTAAMGRRGPVLRDEDVIVRPGPFTVDDLDALPDDGMRHELIDGVLVMSPAPKVRHQVVLQNLHALLDASAPSDLLVLFAPVEFRRAPMSAIQPDIVVLRRACLDLDKHFVTEAPVLAVEVLSPSTRTYDLHDKRRILEEAGCRSYWVVDPEGAELVAWELEDGAYREVARVSGEESWTAEWPFRLTITPAALREARRPRR